MKQNKHATGKEKAPERYLLTPKLRFEKNKERLIDGLVKAIFGYDDYIKLILTFDDKPINIPTTEEIKYMANSSDIQSSTSPKKSR